MNAYVAVTDRDWFDFLAAQDGVDEVNFWQPNPWGGGSECSVVASRCSSS
jgi:hypothetical protein